MQINTTKIITINMWHVSGKLHTRLLFFCNKIWTAWLCTYKWSKWRQQIWLTKTWSYFGPELPSQTLLKIEPQILLQFIHS